MMWRVEESESANRSINETGAGCFFVVRLTFINPVSKESKMGFVIEDVQEGTGKTAQKGKDITVHYTGYLTDGTVFDSSVSRGQPLTITLGVGQVIRGWDEGFDGMKEGGKRKLTIPPEMGYGARAVGGVIPANSTLVFEVELLRVHD
ncbi:peptidylprolyl isomerase [Kingella denitrificans ATCC 33394]|uniref:Peptidyl-prolyl cis-trans isomerase n=2 Tax=Kingella denitrificans TaxID=502 RepID=F0F0X6_9NEIS|nr:peptidylprolyl isomerase [Kingella denitrificans ATCC 33394]